MSWLKNKNKFTIALFVTGALITLSVGVQVATLSSTNTPTKLPSLSISNQLEALTYYEDLSTIQNNKDRSIEGLLPVTVLSTNQYLKLLKQNHKNITTATVNPDTRITSMAVISDKTTTLYASYFLSNQTNMLMTDYGQGLIKVNVTPVASTGVTAPANTGRYSVLSPYLQTGAPTGVSSSPSKGISFNSIFILALISISIIILILRSLQKHKKKKTDSKAKIEEEKVPAVRFDDVAGCDEAIEDIREYAEFINDPDKFTRLGALPPKGALLVGPPGTGKTLLARALAGESGLPFISVAGSDFVEKYVGVGAQRVRELFEKAKKHPEGAIIFIDEIDAVGRARGDTSGGGGNIEHEGTLNALLVQMDGFEKHKIIVIGATNRPDMLDKALTRPGRFDKKIQVPLPDVLGREQIFNVHLRGKPISNKVSVNLLAKRTYDMSGADIAQVVNEACMFAARANRDEVTPEDFSEAIETVFMGKARTSAVVTEKDKILTAWHEAGHTVSSMVLDDANRPGSVSIVPRGPAGGITWMIPNEGMYLTRKAAFAGLVVAMSGRAAEELLLNGEFTSGPHGDLSAATQSAMVMVTQYGMSDGALMVKDQNTISEKNLEAVESLLNKALNIARKTLKSHRELLDNLVVNLLEHETLSHEQLLAIAGGAKIVSPVLPPAPRNAPKKVIKKVVVRKSSKKDNDSDDNLSLEGILAKNPFKKKKVVALKTTVANKTKRTKPEVKS